MSLGGAVVVTGAAGLIGGAVVRLLESRGAEVVGVDRLDADGRGRQLNALRGGDYFDAEEFLERLERDRPVLRVGAIVHLGATTSTTEGNEAWLMRNNYGHTRRLADWCLRHGARFVYASSAATYGDGRDGFEDDPEQLPRLRPLNAYGRSKHLFDLWARAAGAFEGRGGIAGLKFFNVYGPEEGHKGEMRSMVLKAYEQILDTGKVQLFQSHRGEYSDGEQRRDFLHVDDAAGVVAWMLDHPRATGIFNVGSGTARTWNELALAVFAAAKRAPRIEYIPMPAAIRGQYQYETRADVRRLRAAGCDWPFRSLEEGAAAYVAHLEH